MTSTLRDATDHTMHTLTDLAHDALRHLEMPHIDMPHIDVRHLGRSRRRPSVGVFAAGAALLLVIVVTVLAVRRRAGTGHTAADVASAPTEQRAAATSAA